MDKEWMHFSIVLSEYRKGVQDFINIAKVDAGDQKEILCPCVRCENRKR